MIFLRCRQKKIVNLALQLAFRRRLIQRKRACSSAMQKWRGRDLDCADGSGVSKNNRQNNNAGNNNEQAGMGIVPYQGNAGGWRNTTVGMGAEYSYMQFVDVTEPQPSGGNHSNATK